MAYAAADAVRPRWLPLGAARLLAVVLAAPVAALVLLSGWTGVDFSKLALDATIAYIDTDAGRSALASLSAADPTKVWTVREAALFIGLGGRGPIIVGDPAQVADQLESWVDDTGIDGFNLAFAVSHDSMRDVVDKARNSNMRHRPVGMGIMGFQDCLHMMRIPFASDDP